MQNKTFLKYILWGKIDGNSIKCMKKNQQYILPSTPFVVTKIMYRNKLNKYAI